jgi:hypothetical protein
MGSKALLGPFDPKRHRPLDLGTVRDTLGGIHADVKRVPGLEVAAELIEMALAEIAAVERRRLTRFPRALFDVSAYTRRKH